MASLQYQGITPRLIAQIVDGIVLAIVNYAIGASMAGAASYSFFGAEALPFVGAGLLVFLLYFAVLEGTWGATIGKMAMKIRVVREDGSACGIGPAFIRNILRIVDILPFLYIIGIIFIQRSDKKQRLGDRIAGTVVVKSAGSVAFVPPTPTTTPAAKFCPNCGAALTADAKFCTKCGSPA